MKRLMQALWEALTDYECSLPGFYIDFVYCYEFVPIKPLISSVFLYTISFNAQARTKIEKEVVLIRIN